MSTLKNDSFVRVIHSIVLLCLVTPVTAYANNQYPKNPCYMNQHLYIGEIGLKKINQNTQARIWHILPQVTTFEPVCTRKTIFIGSHDGLYSIDSKTGKIQWSVAKGSTLYSPVINGDFVYVSGQDGQIRKLQSDSGKLIWKKQLTGWLYPPVVTNSSVIVGGEARKLYAFNNEDGQLLWQRSVGQELVYRPILAKPDIVVITTYNAEVLALNSKTNEILWSKINASTPYTPVAEHDQLFYGDQDGLVHAVNINTGQENWQTQLNGVIRSIPAIDNTHLNTIWIGTEKGQLAALNKTTGDIQWNKQLTDPIVHTPMPLNNKVYFKVDSKNLMFESFSIPQ